jgi:hypothetical protein
MRKVYILQIYRESGDPTKNESVHHPAEIVAVYSSHKKASSQMQALTQNGIVRLPKIAIRPNERFEIVECVIE